MDAVRGFANIVRRAPLVRTFLKTATWRSLRHQIALLGERKNYTFTHFLRLPTQYEALAGPVLDHVAPAGTARPLDIIDIGCSTGAEPYSIASLLARRRPDLAFTIRAFDIDPDVLLRARAGRYSETEVLDNKVVTTEFVDGTFDRQGDMFTVKPEIARQVSFGTADLRDPRIRETVGTADIAFAQNLLYHFPPRVARRAFANLITLLRPRSALFIDGMDLGTRRRLTRAAGLVPLDYHVEGIHNEAGLLRTAAWPWVYWGLEPYHASRKDCLWRYATVFLRLAAHPAQ